MRFIYTAIFYIALPFLFLRLYWRSRRLPAYRKKWRERLGYPNFQVENAIWIHAVSLGETIAAIPLIKSLQQAYPANPIVITNMTPTGAERVKTAFGDSVYQSYVPYDVPSFINRFIKHVKPKILVVVETELWPNLFAVCRQHQVPIVVTNARLSQRSFEGYAKVPSVNRELFSAIHRLAAQADADAKRFAMLGLPKEKIVVTGNIKFDLFFPDDLVIHANKLRETLGKNRLIWIAASTHAGEEEMILAAHRYLLKSLPTLLLVLVPRHPDRFAEVTTLLQKEKFVFVKRSTGENPSVNTQVYLGDTLGELMMMYAVADVTFMGGSLVKVGGHNMLEPAALSKPIITGPALFNFADISQQLLAAKGMIMVEDQAALQEALLLLLIDENVRNQMGENAYNVVARNRGALQQQVDLIRQAVSL